MKKHTWTILGWLVVSSALPSSMAAAELQAETLAAWENYKWLTEVRIQREIDSSDGFLVRDFLDKSKRAEIRSSLADGEIFIKKMTTSNEEGKERFINSVPRESLEATLRPLRDAFAEAAKLRTEALKAPEASTVEVREELLGTKAPDADPDDPFDVASPDARRVAWRERRDQGWVVMVNGEGGDTYDDVDTPVFSSGGQHFAYRSQGAGKWAMVVDGKATMRVIGKNTIRGVAFEELGPAQFGADGRRVAYRVENKRKARVIVDGEAGPVYDDVGDPAFSPDGKHVLYPAERKKKWVVVVDGEEHGPEMKAIWLGKITVGDETILEGLAWVQFHDELGPMWVGHADKGWSLVVEGKPGPEFGALTWPVHFGSEGRRFAYAGAEIDTGFGGASKGIGQIIVDGESGPSYEGKPTKSFGMALFDTVGAGYWGFYGAVIHGAVTARMLAGVNYPWRYGLVPGVFEDFGVRRYGVSAPQVSPDGEHIAYAARRDEKDYVVVVDGKMGPSFESIACGPRFTAGGTLVYVGVEGNGLVLMKDGERSSEFPWKDADCAAMWVVQGDHIVYAAHHESRWRVFVDGTAGPEHEASSVAVETHLVGEKLRLAYSVHGRNDEGASFVVLDGNEGKRYDEVFAGSLHFSEDGAVTYVAREGRKFFRVSRPRP